MTVSEPVAKWCCNGDPERADKPVGDRGHAPTCRYHESNYAPSNPPPARAEPGRGAPDAALKALRQWEADTEAPARANEGNAFIDGFQAGRAGHVVLLEALKHMKANFYDDFGDQCTECGEKVGTDASCDSCRVYAEAEAAIKQAEGE